MGESSSKDFNCSFYSRLVLLILSLTFGFIFDVEKIKLFSYYIVQNYNILNNKIIIKLD